MSDTSSKQLDQPMLTPLVRNEPVVLDLVNLRPGPDTVALTPLHRYRAAIVDFIRRNLLFTVVVVVPMLLSGIYFGLLTADRYEAEARFVVRNQGLSMQPIGALLAQGGTTRSVDDAYAINSYIISQDALTRLAARVDLKEIMGRASTDPAWRFPQLFSTMSADAMFRQYQRLVTVKLDKTTGITALKVQAFAPRDAALIATLLLDDAERLANQLSGRSREDAVRAATVELDIAKRRVDEAQNRVTEFRNRERVVDPTRISNAVVETIARLSLEIAQTNAQLSEMQRAASQSPQIATLRTRISALERQVVREREQLAGTDTALAQKIADYERLVLEKDFAERLLTSAANSAEAARLDSQRQQLYVERIVTPSLPDWPAAPLRWFWFGATLLLCLTTFAALRSAFSAKTREPHR